MRYAAIADVHGNYPALAAVLADAAEQEMDRYIFLGDYYLDLPFPNDVANTIRSLENAYVIKGNKEDYFSKLPPDQSEWIYDQLAPLYWNYRELTAENLQYLKMLPREMTIIGDLGEYLRLFHSAADVFSGTCVTSLRSDAFYNKMKEKPFTHNEYLIYAEELLLADGRLRELLRTINDGAYLFGHSHVQWHCQLDGKLLLNPGSCGMPLGFDTSAHYSLLECKDGKWRVEERRVPYDAEEAVSALKASGLYESAPAWGDASIMHLRSGEERIGHLLEIACEMAEEAGVTASPYPNYIWRMACEKWRTRKY